MSRRKRTDRVKATRIRTVIEAAKRHIDSPTANPNEADNARRAIERLTAETPGSRRFKGVRVTATCQFPDECADHTFTYVKTTKPQVYCPAHFTGYTDENGKPHGGERNVRVVRDPDGKIIGRRLVMEVRSEHNTFIGTDIVPGGRWSIIGKLRNAGARWLQRLGLPLMGLYADADAPGPLAPGERTSENMADPFQWRVDEVVESPGIVATTKTIVLDGQGRPRFDPKLVRALTVTEVEFQPKGSGSNIGGHIESAQGRGPLSLDFPLATERDQPSMTAGGTISADKGALVAPGIREAPISGPVLPDALRRLEVVFGRVLLGLAKGWEYARHREVWRIDPLLAAQIERGVAAARQEAIWRQAALDAGEPVSPVQAITGPSSQQQRKSS
jgi:hypothetical protein